VDEGGLSMVHVLSWCDDRENEAGPCWKFFAAVVSSSTTSLQLFFRNCGSHTSCRSIVACFYGQISNTTLAFFVGRREYMIYTLRLSGGFDHI
jgi:hypothetical protein